MARDRQRIFGEIHDERERQDERFGSWSTGGNEMSHPEKLGVLMEEVGEVAEAVVQQIGDRRFAQGRGEHAEDLRAELVQVASVAVAWVEAIDAEEGPEAREGDERG